VAGCTFCWANLMPKRGQRRHKAMCVSLHLKPPAELYWLVVCPNSCFPQMQTAFIGVSGIILLWVLVYVISKLYWAVVLKCKLSLICQRMQNVAKKHLTSTIILIYKDPTTVAKHHLYYEKHGSHKTAHSFKGEA